MRKQGLPVQRLATADALLSIASELRYLDLTALYAAVGEGRVSAQSIVAKLVRSLGGLAGAEEDLAEVALPTTPEAAAPHATGDSGVVVEDAADVWAGLSSAAPQGARGRDPRLRHAWAHGVSVHGANVSAVNFIHLAETQPERPWSTVHWSPTDIR